MAHKKLDKSALVSLLSQKNDECLPEIQVTATSLLLNGKGWYVTFTIRDDFWDELSDNQARNDYVDFMVQCVESEFPDDKEIHSWSFHRPLKTAWHEL